MFKFIKLLLISLCFVSTISFAEDEPKSVIVSGTGGTREIALNNAFRHAVEQAVGMMVSSESYVKNLKDIQDKVFLVSNGFIEQYKVLTEDHDTTGYAVTISAVVRQKQLKTAMSSATDTVMPLDGGALFANQMLKEDKAKAYSEEIVKFLDDLISNGFEYKYGTPELIPAEKVGKDIGGAYYLFLPNFEVYLRKDWLASLSKYRNNLSEENIYHDAINLLNLNRQDSRDKSDGIVNIIRFRFEAQDELGDVVAYRDSAPSGDWTDKYIYLRAERSVSTILGLHSRGDYENFRYPNTPDRLRMLASINGSRTHFTDNVFFGPLTPESASKIKKIVIKAADSNTKCNSDRF